MQEVYFTQIGEDTIAIFQDTLKVLDDYFIPKANVPFERHCLGRSHRRIMKPWIRLSVGFVSVRLAVTSENKRLTIFMIK